MLRHADLPKDESGQDDLQVPPDPDGGRKESSGRETCQGCADLRKGFKVNVMNTLNKLNCCKVTKDQNGILQCMMKKM